MLDKDPRSKLYYKISYFIIANQVVFKRLVVVLLILICVVVWWIGGTKLVKNISEIDEYNYMLTEMAKDHINWQEQHIKNKVKDIQIEEINKIKTEKDKYDFVAKISNPNFNWYAKNIRYAFEVDGYILDWQDTFILPGQEKYLFKFSYESKIQPQDLDLKIKDISWQRVKNEDEDRINILEDIIIEQEDFSAGKDFSQLEFTGINNGLYNFWQIGWQVVLYQGSRPIAAHYITTQEFLAGDEKQISAAWIENLSSPSKTEIIPDINLFDDNIYITDPDTPPVNLIKGAKDKK